MEEEHERGYRALLKNIEEGTVFKKNKKIKRRCRNCGYVYQAMKSLGYARCVYTRRRTTKYTLENY